MSAAATTSTSPATRECRPTGVGWDATSRRDGCARAGECCISAASCPGSRSKRVVCRSAGGGSARLARARGQLSGGTPQRRSQLGCGAVVPAAAIERRTCKRRTFIVRGAFAVLGVGVGGLARSVSGPAALAAPTTVADGRTGLLESSAVSSPPLRDADYWQFADWLQGALDRLWNEAHQTYTTDARLSACVLMTHAIAALKGHDGGSRDDARARALALALCESPPFRPARNGRPTRHTDPRSESQAHAPGWVSSVAQADSPQHITVDPKVARALYYAWRARDELNLPPSTVDRIVQCVSSVAHSPFFRYPNVRLNQINFAAELQACAASMTGDTSLLRRDYRHQLARFVNGATRSVRPWRIPNLGPSYSFHRNPFQRAGANQNIESAEYANIVLDVIYYYEQARRAGMTPLSEGQ